MTVIKRNIGLEEMKSRIPGLFPYLEFDEFGVLVKHKATDSIDGCYGKIIPDLNGKSYRTLITEYYNGEDNIIVYSEDPSKIIRVSDVIGKFEVNLSEYDEEQTLVPEYVYAAEAKKLMDEMCKLKKACEYSNLSLQLCCECLEYEKRGGDKMKDFLLSVIENANEIADTVLSVFDNDANMRLNVNLSCNIEDAGYYTSVKSDAVDFNGIISDANFVCHRETLYSKYSKDGIDAPLELPNSENSQSGDSQLWFSSDSDDMVWIAEHDEISSTWRVLKKNGISQLGGHTDSKIKSFRRYASYINDLGVSEMPENGKDWLYFYRKGYVANYETINDDFGNIAFMDNGISPITDDVGYVKNLEAYGNVLYDIERNQESNTITFTYYINAHLKAKLADEILDDDGNKLYYYKYPFVYESGGVKQTDTYFYAEDDDISLLSDDDFQKLISPQENEMDFAKSTNKKYEFFTMNTVGDYDRVIFGKKANVKYNYSEFEYDVQKPDVETDYCYVVFKEDYLTGVHFAPIVSSTVNIQRGNNAAFERHIRLGEVKTLEDMENYQNGSFFNIQESI